MFKRERQAEILRLLDVDGRVAVTDLAQRFEVTEDCIRKDLQQLDHEGRCHRVYGGAVSVGMLPNPNVTQRVDDYRTEKEQLAAKAYPLIQDGQTIFLDVASTNLYLAKLLAASPRRIVVVSNMLDVLKTVAAAPGINAQCPGGKVNVVLNGIVGAATVEALKNQHFDLAFIGTLELDVEDDRVSTFDQEDGLVKRAAIESSSRTYLMADSHKFMTHGGYRYGKISEFTGLITDDHRPELCDAVRALGIEVL